MAGSKNFKTLRKGIEALGYEVSHRNAKNFWVFSCEGFADEVVNPSIADGAARQLLSKLQRMHGVNEEVHKRSPTKAKARQAAERERAHVEAARHKAEITRLLARRSELLGGLGSVLTDREVAVISRQIEAEERELRRWQMLMQEIPDVNAHSGRLVAQHRS